MKRDSETQGLPCLMKSAELCSENFAKIAMAPKRCIIAHFFKMIILYHKSLSFILFATMLSNTFEFKTYTFAPQLKTVDKLFLYCYNVENY